MSAVSDVFPFGLWAAWLLRCSIVVASLRVQCPCLKNKEAGKLDLRVGSTVVPFKDGFIKWNLDLAGGVVRRLRLDLPAAWLVALSGHLAGVLCFRGLRQDWGLCSLLSAAAVCVRHSSPLTSHLAATFLLSPLPPHPNTGSTVALSAGLCPWFLYLVCLPSPNPCRCFLFCDFSSFCSSSQPLVPKPCLRPSFL